MPVPNSFEIVEGRNYTVRIRFGRIVFERVEQNDELSVHYRCQTDVHIMLFKNDRAGGLYEVLVTDAVSNRGSTFRNSFSGRRVVKKGEDRFEEFLVAVDLGLTVLNLILLRKVQ